MAKRLHTSEKKLRVRSDEVNLKDKEELQEVKKVISEMREVLKSKEDLIALTAKQLGSDKRVICTLRCGKSILRCRADRK